MTDPSNSTPTKERLNLISSHLTPSSSSNTSKPTIMAAPQRDPITCHVLDTTTGRPGAGIAVSLFPVRSPETSFYSTTSADGRITNWKPLIHNNTLPQESVAAHITSLISVLGGGQESKNGGLETGSSLWKLTFKTGEYYGTGKTFFPVVELTFVVKAGEHFHVPLLLGPYSFTTYRGS